MTARIPLFGDLSLEIDDTRGRDVGPSGDGRTGERYPTGRLQKGLLLLDAGESLAEEGVGFGVPVVKLGVRTVFPGRVDVTCVREGADWEVTATYVMDLVERLARARGERPPAGGAGSSIADPAEAGVVRSRVLYAAKDSLAALHRRSPRLRGPLGATSAAVRRAFGWVTTYETTASCGEISVRHAVRPLDGGAGVSGGARRDAAAADGAACRVAVTVDLSGLTAPEVSEVVVMNEQGARCFDRYEDGGGAVRRGADIGTWDEVDGPRASFVSTGHRVAFSLGPAPPARLYRGRELVGSRLAWAGFGYALPPAQRSFDYELAVARTSCLRS